MRVRMLVTQWAAADESGATSTRYNRGQEYDLPPALALVFLSEGFAERAGAAPALSLSGPSETQELAPGEAQGGKPGEPYGQDDDRKPGGRIRRLGRKKGSKA